MCNSREKECRPERLVTVPEAHLRPMALETTFHTGISIEHGGLLALPLPLGLAVLAGLHVGASRMRLGLHLARQPGLPCRHTRRILE